LGVFDLLGVRRVYRVCGGAEGGGKKRRRTCIVARGAVYWGSVWWSYRTWADEVDGPLWRSVSHAKLVGFWDQCKVCPEVNGSSNRFNVWTRDAQCGRRGAWLDIEKGVKNE